MSAARLPVPTLSIAGRFARRELRGGWRGFRILVGCLALGVAAIAAAGSLKAAFHRGIDDNARALLGGDVEIRQSYAPLDAEQRAEFSRFGRLSEGVELRAMARAGESRRLVELKAVDAAYPLAGTLELQPAMTPAAAFEQKDGVWGAVADPGLMARLGLKVGDWVTVGDASFQLRAAIAREPDRVAQVFAFGPRLMVSVAALPATGLMLPGSVVRHFARLALAGGHTAAEARAALENRFPQAGWQLRVAAQAAPMVERVLDNIAAFLTLVGFTALLVGGIGVANAVKAYLDGRADTIAILKGIGAPARVIFATYGLLIGGMALLGVLIGLAAGALVSLAVVTFAGDLLPVAAHGGLYPLPLLAAAGCGMLTALVFALWPLARARALPAAALLRRLEGEGGTPDRITLAVLGLAVAGLAGMAVTTAERPMLAAVFVVASAATLGIFRVLAWGLSRAAAWASARHAVGHPSARLALAALHRPGSTVVGVVLSLGLGLTVLVAIAQVEGNLARQFGETLPRSAPSFFFIDIQPDQTAAFTEAVHQVAPEAAVEMAPLVRGRVVKVAGEPIAQVPVAQDAQWVVRGDRGLTVADRPPAGTKLAAGQWWPADYQGPPLASVEAGVARGLGLKVGDTVAVNVLGRELTLTVASLRQVQWSTLDMNFAFILSPNALAGAPVTWIATVHLPAGKDDAVEKAVTDRLLNVSAIRVKEALETVRGIIANADLAVRLAGLVTLAAGALVLGGAVMAGHRRRVREAVILKVLGATSGDLWRAWLLEFGLVGAVTGVAAGAIGTAAAWAVLTQAMHADWTLLPGNAAATLVTCIAASLLAGFAGTLAALRSKAAPLLRGE